MAVQAKSFREYFASCPHKDEVSFFTDGKIWHYAKSGKRVLCQDFSKEVSTKDVVVENQSSVKSLTNDVGCVKMKAYEHTGRELAIIRLCEFANGTCGCQTLSKPTFCSLTERAYERIIELTLKD